MDFSPGRRSALCFLLVLFGLAVAWPSMAAPVAASPSAQAVNLCMDGTLTTNGRFTTTLTLPAGEYAADCGLMVNEDVTLTVPTGVTLRFGENGAMAVDGRLEVTGGSAGDVTFTSDAAVQAKGQWRGLTIDDEGSASLSGIELSYGGRSGASIIQSSGAISMSNVIVREGEGSAVEIRGADASFDGVSLSAVDGIGLEIQANRERIINVAIRNSVFQDITEAAVESSPEVQFELADNQVRDSGVNGIELKAGTVEGPVTLRGGDMPYVVTGSETYEAALTIEPNTIIKFAGGKIRSTNGGSIDAQGTEGNEVYFTTITDDAACLFAGDPNPRIVCDTGNDGDKAQEPGAWERVLIDDGSVPGAIRHTILRYGDIGALTFDEPGYTVENVTIEQSKRVGIVVNNTGDDYEEMYFTLRDSEISGSGEVGLQVDVRGYSEVTLENNRFIDNTIAVAADADVELIVSGNTSEGEGLNGFRINGDMSRAHTWRAGDLPFVPADEIDLLNAGTVLTIEPGAVVKAIANAAIDVNRGRLEAGSLDGDTVLFTSVEDDACSVDEDSGCDTNGDGSQSEGEPGDWRRIIVPDDSLGALLHNVELRYGGSGNQPLVTIESSDVEVRGSTIHHGEGHGIGIELAQPLIEDNDIHSNGVSGNGGAGIRIESGQLELQVGFRNNRIYNNNGGAVQIDANVELQLDGSNSTEEPAGFDADPRQPQLNGIVVAGVVSQNVDWRAGNLPFVIVNSVSVDSQSTLTLEPGVRVKFDESGKLSLRSGTIEAVGTESEPIILTSIADPVGGETKADSGSPRKGDWPGLVFGKPGVSGRTVRLEYVEVRYSGAGDDPAIQIEQNDVVIDHCTITEAAGHGIYIVDAEGVVISNNTLDDILGDGINVTTSQGLTLELTDNTISNSSNAVHIDGDVQLTSSNNTVTDNSINGVLVTGKVSKIRTWGAGDMIWVLDDIVRVDRGTLTIEAGAVVKGTLDSVLSLSNGALNMNAAIEEAGILLTSIADDSCGELQPDEVCDTDGVDQTPRPGDWVGVKLDSAGDSAVLRNVTIHHAGGTEGGAALEIEVPRGAVLEASEIALSGSGGVKLRGAESVLISDTLFLDNRAAGIYLDRESSARIIANTFVGNNRPVEIHTKGDVETEANVSVGNENDALLLSEDVTTSQTWKNDFVRDIDDSITVDAELSVEPGSLLRFTKNSGIKVEDTFEARGVVFTADQVDAENGYWNGLSFVDSARGSARHNIFAFAGSSSTGAIHMSVDGTIPVQYNYFLRSDGNAISASGDRVDPLIEGNVIRGVEGRAANAIEIRGPARGGGDRSLIINNFIANVDNGIELTRKNAQVALNHLAGVFQRGIVNETSNLCIEAENNWWGDSRGPRDDHPEDAGDPCGEDKNASNGPGVSKFVKWAPPLTEAPPALPVLDLPRSGSTNQTEVTVAGRGRGGDDLLIFDADAVDPIGRVTIDSGGRFETTINLSRGSHELSVATEKSVAGVGEPLRSARVGFRLVVVDPDSVIDPASIGFVYGNRVGPQVQPLSDVTGAAPACGGPGPGRVVLPRGMEVVARLKADGAQNLVELVQGDMTVPMTRGGSGFYETAPFVPEQGPFQLRADGDDVGACRGFIFLGGAGTVFSDQGAPANPILESNFEGEFGSNDGWIRDDPWAPVKGNASLGEWSMATGTYEANTDASLTLAEQIDLNTMVAPEIRFDQRYELARNDRIFVEIQLETDGRWSRIADFQGERLGWHGVTVSLDEFAKEPRVKLRFRIDANSDDTVGGGWWLDDIRIQSGGEDNGRLDEGEPVITGAEVLLSQLNPEDGKMVVWDGRATGQFNPQITDGSGRFAFFALPPGQYRLQITPPPGSGLQPFLSNPPYVVVDGTLAIDVPLNEAGAIYMPYTVRDAVMRR